MRLFFEGKLFPSVCDWKKPQLFSTYFSRKNPEGIVCMHNWVSNSIKIVVSKWLRSKKTGIMRVILHKIFKNINLSTGVGGEGTLLIFSSCLFIYCLLLFGGCWSLGWKIVYSYPQRIWIWYTTPPEQTSFQLQNSSQLQLKGPKKSYATP